MILNNGKIIAENTPSNLVNDINVRNAYFGDNCSINFNVKHCKNKR